MAQSSGVARAAVRHLRLADPAMAAVISHVGPCRFQVHTEGTHFEAITRSIVYQQLSGSAARTIYGRVQAALGEVTPRAVLAVSDETLRAAGLSRQKIGYVRDLAARADSGDLAVERLHELTDAEVLESMCAVKGIGRWTAQIFLMFRLGRPDVLPELDLGVRKGAQRAYRMRSLPSTKRLMKLGEKWAPYRTYAAWYLWRLLDE